MDVLLFPFAFEIAIAIYSICTAHATSLQLTWICEYRFTYTHCVFAYMRFSLHLSSLIYICMYFILIFTLLTNEPAFYMPLCLLYYLIIKKILNDRRGGLRKLIHTFSVERHTEKYLKRSIIKSDLVTCLIEISL